jgi:hypothetical protein
MTHLSRLAAMPARPRIALLAVAALAVAAAAGCGSSKELPKDIPAASVPGLTQNLEAVLQACSVGDHVGAVSAAQEYANAVAALPSSVSADTRDVLNQTADNLSTLAQSDAGCKAQTTGPSGEQGPQVDTTSTQTTTTTAPPTTDTTTTTDTQAAPPSAPPDNPGGGNPGGGNPGGGNPGGGNGGGNSGGIGAGKSAGAPGGHG